MLEKIQTCSIWYRIRIYSNKCARDIIRALPHIGLKEIYPGGKGRDYALARGSSREYEAKIYRIFDQVSPPLEREQIYVNAQIPFYDDFVKEFRFLGTTKHDDIMDSWGNCLEMVDRDAVAMFLMSGRDGYYRYDTSF